jgi:hypothetical protein
MADPAIPTPNESAAVPALGEETAPASPAPSPFGHIGQYRRREGPAEFVHPVSVTGATLEDPTGELSRQRMEQDPDWASPVRWFTKPLEEFGTSVAVYWFGYGVIQAVLVTLAAWLTGSLDHLTAGGYAAMLGFGPAYGTLMDVAAMATGGWALPVGLLLFFAEPALFFLFFFCAEWTDRLKCCLIMFGMIAIRVLILSFA